MITPFRRFWFSSALRVFVLIIIIMLSPAVFADDPDASPEALLSLAAARLKAGEYDKSVELCDRARASGQDKTLWGKAQFLAGYCEYKQKKYDSARSRFYQASKLHPELSYHGLFYGALTYQDAENYSEAVPLWEKLISSDPPGDLKGRAMMELLRCRRRGEAPEEAVKVLQRLAALKSTEKDGLWDREIDYTSAWAKTMTGSVAEARKELVKLWRDHPTNFWADQAEELLEKHKDSYLLPGETTPFSEGDRIKRIENLIDKSYATRALSELAPIVEKAEKGSPPKRVADLYKLQAKAHQAKREFTKSIEILTKAQALTSAEDVEIMYLIASAYRRSGKHDEAVAVYDAIWTRHPSSEYATRGLFYGARLKKINNDWEGAESRYRKLASDYPHSTLRSESLFQIAWIKYLKKEYAKSMAYISKVPRSSKDKEFNARSQYWKAVLHRKLGQPDQAVPLEANILSKYWKTPYAYYVSTQVGAKWPHPATKSVIPPEQPNPPLEYRIAHELSLLGISDESEGQLKALERQGRMPEWLAWKISRMHYELGDYYMSQRVAQRNFGSRLNTPPPGEADAWRAAYPKAYPELTAKYAKERGLDPFLVWSLMRAESTYRPTIKSSAGAIGLMQIMPDTGKQIAKGLGEKGYSSSKLNDPETNIRYGCYYLANRLEQFGVNEATTADARLKTITRALGSYNAGPQRMKRWAERADELGLDAPAFVEEIPIKETREYVKRILGFYMAYYYSYPEARTGGQ